MSPLPTRRANKCVQEIVCLLFVCASIAFGGVAVAGGGAPPSNLTHPCSRSISRAVRKVLQKEVLRPASKAGVDQWSKHCDFDPSRDLYGEHERQKTRDRRSSLWVCGINGKTFKTEHYIDLHLERRHMNLSPIDGVCLADYCEVFEVCHGETRWRSRKKKRECDQEELVRVRHRCEDALHNCFPIDQEASRRLHAELSRHYCQPLDCRIRAEKRREQDAEDLPIVVHLIMILLVCLILFSIVLCLVHTGEDSADPKSSRSMAMTTPRAARHTARPYTPVPLGARSSARLRRGTRSFID